MKNYQLNSDKEYVKRIIEGIYKKDGHCPCKLKQDDTTLCPCDEFIETGDCKCKLYVPKKNKEEN